MAEPLEDVRYVLLAGALAAGVSLHVISGNRGTASIYRVLCMYLMYSVEQHEQHEQHVLSIRGGLEVGIEYRVLIRRIY